MSRSQDATAISRRLLEEDVARHEESIRRLEMAGTCWVCRSCGSAWPHSIKPHLTPYETRFCTACNEKLQKGGIAMLRDLYHETVEYMQFCRCLFVRANQEKRRLRAEVERMKKYAARCGGWTCSSCQQDFGPSDWFAGGDHKRRCKACAPKGGIR